MNRIFKVIWNEVKHCYVVVSELARGYVKRASRRQRVKLSKKALTMTILAAFASVALVWSPVAYADDDDWIGVSHDHYSDNQKIGSHVNGTLTNPELPSLNEGGKGTNAIGKASSVSDNDTVASAITIGSDAGAGTGTISIGGKYAKPSTYSVFLGEQARIAAYTYNEDTDADTAKEESTGTNVIAIGYNSRASNKDGVLNTYSDYTNYSGAENIQEKENNRTSYVSTTVSSKGAGGAIAIGSNAKADGGNIAIGANSLALRKNNTDDSYVSFGNDAYTETMYAETSSVTLEGTRKQTTVTVTHPETNRRLTHVAAGTSANEASTVGQVIDLIGDTYAAGTDITFDTTYKQDSSGNYVDDYGNIVYTKLSNGSYHDVTDTTNSESTATDFSNAAKIYKISANPTGTVVDGNTNTVSGGTLYTEVRPTDGTYVKKDNTTAANLNALDKQVATNTSNISTNTSNIATNTSNITNINSTLDTLSDNAVQYDTSSNYGTVTLKGTSGTKLTNLQDATLSATSKDAVTGKQLYTTNQNLSTLQNNYSTLNTTVNNLSTNVSNQMTEVTVEGGKSANLNATTTTTSGNNKITEYVGDKLKLRITEDQTTGKKTYDLMLNDALSSDSMTVGQAGKDGVSGTNGKDGKDGQIGIAGKNGDKGTDGTDAESITTTIIKTEKGQTGKAGKDGHDGQAGANGVPGVDGKDITRIVYQNNDDKTTDNPDGKHYVATLDDGLKFAGDATEGSTTNSSIGVKLNNLVTLTGTTFTTESPYTSTDWTGDNIAVVSSTDGTNATMSLKLNKDLKLTKDGSVNFGNTTYDASGITVTDTSSTTSTTYKFSTDGIDAGGKVISNVGSNGTNTENNSNVATIADVKTLVSQSTTTVDKGIEDSETTTVDSTGTKYKINVKTTGQVVDGNTDIVTGGTVYKALNDALTGGTKDIVAGKDGKDGSDGQDGSIGIAGKNGKDGTDGNNITTTIIKTEKGQPGENGKNGEPGVNGTDITRIVYENEENKDGKHVVATLDDGMKYSGDNYTAATTTDAEKNVIAKKLNERVSIRGNTAANAALTDGNIGVNVATDTSDNNSQYLHVQLNKDLNLYTTGENAGTGSITFGENGTKIDNTGLTVSGGPSVTTTKVGFDDGPSITKDGIDANNKAINNVGRGGKATTEGGTTTYSYDADDVQTNAATIADARGIAQEMASSVKDDLTNGSVTKIIAGKDGKDGAQGATGEKGETGSIGIAGKNGKDGTDGNNITTTIITTEKGQTGTAGANGHDGQAGTNGVPGVDGTDITRIVYQNDDDITTDNPTGRHYIATLDDGLIFAGDNNTTIAKKLNETVVFVGRDSSSYGTYDTTRKTYSNLTSDNIAVYVDSNDDNKIKVQLAKDVNLTNNGSIKFGTDTENSKVTVLDGNGLVVRDNSGNVVVKVAADNATDPDRNKIVATHEYVETQIQNSMSSGDNIKIIAGKDGKDGVDGKAGEIGIAGKNGKNGTDGKEGVTTTIIKTEKGQTGADGKNGKPGVDGKDITRIVYENPDDKVDPNDPDSANQRHYVATLDDGMSYAGDYGTAANVALNHQVKLTGGGTVTSYEGWTNGNIAAFSQAVDGAGNAVVSLKLNKDLNLSAPVYQKDANGNVVVDSNGNPVQEKDANGNPKTESGSITFGDNDKSTKLDNSGLSVKDENGTERTNVGTNGVSVKDENGTERTNIGTNGMSVKDEQGNEKTAINTDGVTITNRSGESSGVTVKSADGTQESKLTEKGLTVTGSDGSSVTVDNNGVTINGNNGGSGSSGSNTTVVINKDGINVGGNNLLDKKADVDGKNLTPDNVASWRSKLGDTDNAVTKDSKELASEGQLYKETRLHSDGTNLTGSYVNSNKSVADNLSALDTQVSTNTQGIATNAQKIAENTARLDQNGTGLITRDGVDSGNPTIHIANNVPATTVDFSGPSETGGASAPRVVTGVATADGTDPYQAANVTYVQQENLAQSQQIYNDMNRAYNHVENDISRATAGANALAALHPMEMDPEDKLQFAMGYGHYRNANAAAVGAFYSPDEYTMFSVGSSFGNGDAGINAGVTFKFGTHDKSTPAMSKKQMARVINEQAKELDTIKTANQQMQAQMAQIIELLKAQGVSVDQLQKTTLTEETPSLTWK